MLCAAGAVALLAGAIALRTAATSGGPSSQPGAACSHQAVSAINQYCENVPAATGGNQAGPGTPSLSSQLSASSRVGGVSGAPSRAAGRRRGRAQSRNVAASRLLGLPAPSARLPLSVTRHAAASGWSLFSGLLIALAALTLALSAAPLARRRVSRA